MGRPLKGWQASGFPLRVVEAALPRLRERGARISINLKRSPRLLALDMDNCVQDGKVVGRLALEFVSDFCTLAEISMSGKGLHIFAVVVGVEKDFSLSARNEGVELYLNTSRHITLTGDYLVPDASILPIVAEDAQTLAQCVESGDWRAWWLLRAQRRLARGDESAREEIELLQAQLAREAKREALRASIDTRITRSSRLSPSRRSESRVVQRAGEVAAAPEGARNNTLYSAACSLRAIGRDIEDAIAALLPAALRAGLSEAEARRTIESAYRRR